MHDFIEVYPQALSPEQCAGIVANFEQSGQAARGRTGTGVDTKLKDSYDITITGRPEWRPGIQLFKGAVVEGLREYIKKYRFAMIGPLALRFQNPDTGQVTLINDEVFDKLDDG